MNPLPDIIELKSRWESVNVRAARAAEKAGRNFEDITIVAVSKTHPAELIKLALAAGIRVFGENYAQELKQKHDEFAGFEIQPEWHFIGHLQTNKVKYIIPFVKVMHSVDSVHLAEEISRRAEQAGRTIDILLQANTSDEASKFGCEPGEMASLAEGVIGLKNINVVGLMTIGSFSEDESICRSEFRLLREIHVELQTNFPNLNLKHLSMGMTNDFEAAIEEGATIVRIGTAIFGERISSMLNAEL